MTAVDPLDKQIADFRHFNRFYTRAVGVLGQYLAQDLSLTDVRVLYEMAHPIAAPLVASDIARAIGMDNGQLSRILKRFETKGWVSRTANPKDGRQSFLELTDLGREAFQPLEERSKREAGALLAPLGEGQRTELSRAMATIEAILSGQPTSSAAPAPPSLSASDGALQAKPSVILRDPRPGDLGWVVSLQGELYYNEYNWDIRFEALIAQVVNEYVHSAHAKRCWIAEAGGERVGSVFIVQGSGPKVAKLRLLAVSPNARGLGVGSKLVDAAIQHCRDEGYDKIQLWTHSVLTAARAMYANRGFKLVSEEEYEGFGVAKLVGEEWELVL